MSILCVPTAAGVPGAGEAPIWWDKTSGSATGLNQRIDDPRWRGAAGGVSYRSEAGGGSGTSPTSFRTLQQVENNKAHLYLLWHVRAGGGTGRSPADRLTVGFRLQDGSALALRVKPFARIQPPPFSETPFRLGVQDLEHATRPSGGAWTGLSPYPVAAPPPSWMRDEAAGRLFAWNVSQQTWGIAMRVPVSTDPQQPLIGEAGMRLQEPVRFWFELQVVAQATSGAGAVYNPYWPSGAPPFATTGFPDPATQFGDLYLGAPPPGVTCKGVSIDWSDIFAEGPAGEQLHEIKRTGANTLVARPRNGTNAVVQANALSAGFRIANWGSNLNWIDVPGGQAVLNAADIAVNAKGRMQFSWTLSQTLSDEFASGQRTRHQCMLVQLSSNTVQFTKDSDYGNFEVVPASTFEREAEIGVQRLPPVGLSPTRATYLIVQALNMPREVPRDYKGPVAALRDHDREEPRRALNLEQLVELHSGYAMEEPEDALRSGAPLMIVYAFHATGEHVRIDGRRYAVVAPQPSFGYAVSHQGPLHGWEHEVSGTWMQWLAPGFYKLSIPAGGAMRVSTRIVARERPPRPWEKLLARLRRCRLRLLRLLWRLLGPLREAWLWLRARLGR